MGRVQRTFHDGHRVHHDCLATLEILAAPLAGSGGSELQALMIAARKPTVRVFAENSPFELKDVLKPRGYRWNGEARPSSRAWWIDVEEADLTVALPQTKRAESRLSGDLLASGHAVLHSIALSTRIVATCSLSFPRLAICFPLLRSAKMQSS